VEGDSVLWLADDFFFVAHDSISMKCRLSDRVMRLGLASALLGEQVLFRRITMRGGQLRVVDATPPRDALAHTVLAYLHAEPTITSVRDWLRFLGGDAYEKVVQRLLREGHINAREERRLLRVATVYEPTATTQASWPESRLVSRLSTGAGLEPPDIVLAGLVAATGLDRYLLSGTPAHARPYLHRVVSSLPPSLTSLIDETAAAVGDAVLSSRT
jgi:Golgi phosphoprotein 3 GPP34